MPSLATRFAYQMSAGAMDSLAQQISELSAGAVTQSDALALLTDATEELTNNGIAQLLAQNSAILRLLSGIYLTLRDEGLPVLSDDDVEDLLQEITP